MKKAAALLLAIISSSVYADTLLFSNGDSLKGDLVKLENGKAVFKTEMAGEITVDRVNIKSIKITSEADFQMADGTVVKSTGTITDTAITLAGDSKKDISTLTAINPTPPELPKLSGNITAGFTSSHGNTFAESGTISIELNYDTEGGTTGTDFTYVATRAERPDGSKYTSEEYFTAGAKREFNLTEKNYGFVDGRYKTDHIADLDQRIIGTLGLGHRFFKTDTFKFNADLGLSELHEKYTVEGVSDTSDELSIRFGYNLSWAVNSKLSFKHNIEYYPSTQTYSDYYLSAKAEFRYKFNDKIYGSFKTLLDFDASPAETVSTTDTKYILGLGIDF